MNFSAVGSSTQRSLNSCSTPHNSGNSESITEPPKLTSISDKYPNAGFAEIPEKPSEPPHSKPMHNLSNPASLRSNLLASTKPVKVDLIAFCINSCSVPSNCCSKTKSGLSK